jgi:two-component system phosphate regulon sensor histidine kinase PhoR
MQVVNSKPTGGDNMRTIEGFMVAPIMQDQKLRTLAAREFQTTLVGMMGHDLRQSLHVIQGTYALLRSRLKDMPQQAFLDRGERAVTKLTEQLDCLVDAFFLAEHVNALEVSSVGLGAMFWRLRLENEDAAIQKGIDLRAVTTNAHVMSNPVLLGCIIRNLLANAIRYTEPGGRILIGCRRKGPEIRIDVFDTGIGIPEQQLHRIFDPFTRAFRRNAATVWASGSLSSVVRSRCSATGSKSDRLWGKGRVSRSTHQRQRRAKASSQLNLFGTGGFPAYT